MLDNLQPGKILMLDHLYISHESRRHDSLKKVNFDILGCSIDPSKEEILAKGKRTWCFDLFAASSGYAEPHGYAYRLLLYVNFFLFSYKATGI